MSVHKYSVPYIVLAKGKQLLGNDFKLVPSTRKDKKYATIDPNTGKKIHFGQMGYQDFTLSKSETKKKAFRTRNAKWKHAKPYSPAYLSYHLLW